MSHPSRPVTTKTLTDFETIAEHTRVYNPDLTLPQANKEDEQFASNSRIVRQLIRLGQGMGDDVYTAHIYFADAWILQNQAQPVLDKKLAENERRQTNQELFQWMASQQFFLAIHYALEHDHVVLDETILKTLKDVENYARVAELIGKPLFKAIDLAKFADKPDVLFALIDVGAPIQEVDLSKFVNHPHILIPLILRGAPIKEGLLAKVLETRDDKLIDQVLQLKKSDVKSAPVVVQTLSGPKAALDVKTAPGAAGTGAADAKAATAGVGASVAASAKAAVAGAADTRGSVVDANEPLLIDQIRLTEGDKRPATIHLAARLGLLPAVRQLLQDPVVKGMIDTNVRTDMGKWDAFYLALSAGKPELLKLLLTPNSFSSPAPTKHFHLHKLIFEAFVARSLRMKEPMNTAIASEQQFQESMLFVINNNKDVFGQSNQQDLNPEEYERLLHRPRVTIDPKTIALQKQLEQIPQSKVQLKSKRHDHERKLAQLDEEIMNSLAEEKSWQAKLTAAQSNPLRVQQEAKRDANGVQRVRLTEELAFLETQQTRLSTLKETRKGLEKEREKLELEHKRVSHALTIAKSAAAKSVKAAAGAVIGSSASDAGKVDDAKTANPAAGATPVTAAAPLKAPVISAEEASLNIQLEDIKSKNMLYLRDINTIRALETTATEFKQQLAQRIAQIKRELQVVMAPLPEVGGIDGIVKTLNSRVEKTQSLHAARRALLQTWHKERAALDLRHKVLQQYEAKKAAWKASIEPEDYSVDKVLFIFHPLKKIWKMLVIKAGQAEMSETDLERIKYPKFIEELEKVNEYNSDRYNTPDLSNRILLRLEGTNPDANTAKFRLETATAAATQPLSVALAPAGVDLKTADAPSSTAADEARIQRDQAVIDAETHAVITESINLRAQLSASVFAHRFVWAARKAMEGKLMPGVENFVVEVGVSQYAQQVQAVQVAAGSVEHRAESSPQIRLATSAEIAVNLTRNASALAGLTAKNSTAAGMAKAAVGAGAPPVPVQTMPLNRFILEHSGDAAAAAAAPAPGATPTAPGAAVNTKAAPAKAGDDKKKDVVKTDAAAAAPAPGATPTAPGAAVNAKAAPAKPGDDKKKDMGKTDAAAAAPAPAPGATPTAPGSAVNTKAAPAQPGDDKKKDVGKADTAAAAAPGATPTPTQPVQLFYEEDDGDTAVEEPHSSDDLSVSTVGAAVKRLTPAAPNPAISASGASTAPVGNTGGAAGGAGRTDAPTTPRPVGSPLAAPPGVSLFSAPPAKGGASASTVTVVQQLPPPQLLVAGSTPASAAAGQQPPSAASPLPALSHQQPLPPFAAGLFSEAAQELMRKKKAAAEAAAAGSTGATPETEAAGAVIR